MIINNLNYTMGKSFLCIAHLLISATLLTMCSSPEEGLNWRGSSRDGFYSETGLLAEWPANGPELLWKFDSLGLGYTSASVTSRRVYITGAVDSIGYLYAFTHKGELLWKKPYGKEWTVNFPGTRSTPLINEGRGYLLSGMGLLLCFDPSNGNAIWKSDLYSDYDGIPVRFGITENLLIDGDMLFCTPGGMDANIIALNKKDGKLIWKSKGVGEASAYCSPTMYEHNGAKYLLTITSNSILALNPHNGAVVWSHDLKYPHGIHGNTPYYSNGYVFAMNGWGFGSVMLKLTNNGTSVEEVWRSKLFDLEHGDVIKIGNNIYGADYTSKHFSCVDWLTGEVKDSVKTLAPASVIAAEGLIYCYTYSGEMALVKPLDNGFEVISRFKLPGEKKDFIAHPVIHNGKLYLRHQNSLWVYSIKRV